MPEPLRAITSAVEDLDALLVAFEDAAVDVDRVADLELRDFRLQAGLFDQAPSIVRSWFFLSLTWSAKPRPAVSVSDPRSAVQRSVTVVSP